MAEDENNQGDMKYYQNQPYDMEVDLNNDGDDEGDIINVKKKANKDVEDGKHEIPMFPDVDSPQIKELPKFDLSKFEDLPASAEAKELLSIMKK
jgi:hypothetical protein